MTSSQNLKSWQELEQLCTFQVPDQANGPTNSHSTMRLFGQDPSTIRVTLYRDHHAWCPYCQKVWLWLEEKRIPYKVKKVTMFCYGTKESWYTQICPRGMLPAIQLDGQLITESDDILMALESEFGPLYKSMSDRRHVVPLRRLERLLFRAWCTWLCYPSRGARDEERKRQYFMEVATQVDASLGATKGPYFLDQFSVVDCVFTPYVERMNASLFYYKGFTLRDSSVYPHLAAWFDAMESRATYRGTQSDFHTHAHDLPPQMGGCYENLSSLQTQCKQRVDLGTDFKLPDTRAAEPPTSRHEALYRVLKHKENVIKVNPHRAKTAVDEALRCALTHLITGESVQPPSGSAAALRYVRDRVSVPRDMSLWAARRFKASLEHTAGLDGTAQGPPIPINNRRDQNPRNFGKY